MYQSAIPEQAAIGYDQRLRSAVVAACRSTTDLRAFLGLLEGADPLCALDALEESLAHGAHPRAASLLTVARTPRPVAPSQLPITHPLDYAWLFAEETQVELIDQARALSRPCDLIVHLGCPTVHSLGQRELPDRRHLLLDRDARRVTLASEARPNSGLVLDVLTDPLPDLIDRAAVVIADPPWYPDSAGGFIDAAAGLLAPSGVLLLAFVGTLTRPDADRDLFRVIAEAEKRGFEVIETRHRACRYEMPPFEQAALEAAGYPGVPQDWRLGTLVMLRRQENPAPPRRVFAEAEWLGHEISDIPLRTRADAPAHGNEILAPLLDGSPLPSVSRRDPRRHNAALWTSRNRIYASCDPPALQRLVIETVDGKRISDKAVAAELNRLIAAERAEHGLLKQ
jgi:hypothetical protein